MHELTNMPAVGMAEYLSELQRHAQEFPRKLAERASWFITSAPWNLLVAKQLAENEKDALFVLVLRRVEGVCQSLERSFAAGNDWAGCDTASRIELWCKFYSNVFDLPQDKLVVIDYDLLCRSPERYIKKLQNDLENLGFPGRSCNLNVLKKVHAGGDLSRPSIVSCRSKK